MKIARISEDGKLLLKNEIVETNSASSSLTESSFSMTELIEIDGVKKGMKVRYIREYMRGNSKNSSNHWRQMEAYDENGVNVALGKPASNDSWTDGITDAGHFSMGDDNTIPAELDLESIYNIHELKSYHFADRRIYYNILLQVSTDNINWTTVFDSNVDGEYQEIAVGKTTVLESKSGVRITENGSLEVIELIEGADL